MAGDKPTWREEEKLRHLVGGHDAPRRTSGTREIRDSGRRSLAEIAELAVADIESNKPRRKYSTDDRPPEVVIRRSRVGIVALGLLIVVAIFTWKKTLTPPPPPIPGDPVEIVAVLSPAARGSAALAPEWSTIASGLGERARAVRIGALIVEMERAVTRDDSTAHTHSEAISALLANTPDAAEVAGLFATLEDARQLTSRAALAPFARAAPMALGAWLQGARVAAAAGDAGFFASQRSRESVRLLLLLPNVSPEVQAARERLDAILLRRGRPDFAAAIGALEVLQRELASERQISE
jgi:hypothetical protein